MRLDFATLRLFVTACRHGSIAAAAEVHHIAASAVSRRLAEMEAEAGVSLLERSKRGVTPTAAGEALLARAGDMLRLADRIEGELADFSSGARGVVRLAANTSAVTQHLPEDIARFLGLYPDVQVELRELVSGAVVGAVTDGICDIGIAAEHVDLRGLASRPYRTDRLVLLTPEAHPLAARSSVRAADLAGCDAVALQDGSSLQALVSGKVREAGAELRVRVDILSFDAVRRMVATGLGVSVLPEGAVEPYRDHLPVRTVPIDEDWALRRLVIVARSFDGLPNAARALLECLEA